MAWKSLEFFVLKNKMADQYYVYFPIFPPGGVVSSGQRQNHQKTHEMVKFKPVLYPAAVASFINTPSAIILNTPVKPTPLRFRKRGGV